MHRHIVYNQVNVGCAPRQVGLYLLQQGDKLDLPFAGGDLAPDLAATGVEARQQVERPSTAILMLDLGGLPRSGGPRRSQTRARLKAGMLVRTNHPLMGG
jgi:hypothetical protein